MFTAEIKRDYKSFAYPMEWADGGMVLSSFGFLIKRGETIDLNEFADRITQHYDNPRADIEAGEIRRWYALRKYATEHLSKQGKLPETFEWEDGTYDSEDILKILGPVSLLRLEAMFSKKPDIPF